MKVTMKMIMGRLLFIRVGQSKATELRYPDFS